MLILVIGGAASGKSAWAESLILKNAVPRYYIATMQVQDTESAARVEKHRAMREGKGFVTVERSLNISQLVLPRRGAVLLEDIGNLTANEMYSPGGAGEAAERAVIDGTLALSAQSGCLVAVSNEVHSGGEHYAGDTACYLKTLARINNSIAARADCVCRVVCGVPVYYKGGEAL